jgi:hypothetical protein
MTQRGFVSKSREASRVGEVRSRIRTAYETDPGLCARQT